MAECQALSLVCANIVRKLQFDSGKHTEDTLVRRELMQFLRHDQFSANKCREDRVWLSHVLHYCCFQKYSNHNGYQTVAIFKYSILRTY